MEEKAWDTSTKNNLPDSSFLYVESGGKKDDQGKTVPRSLRHLPYKDANGKVDLPHLRNALSRLGQANTGSEGWLSESLRKRLISKAEGVLKAHRKEIDEMLEEIVVEAENLETADEPEDTEAALDVVEEISFVEVKNELKGLQALIAKAKERFTALFSEPEETKEIENQTSILITKNKAGEYVWMARYSNNIRDIDNPPEIISAKSHKRFVDMVDKGEYPLPELWLWHIKEWKFGDAAVVDFDEETGFAIAAGYIDKDKYEFAESLAAIDPTQLRVSHGMPVGSIVRDEEDPTVIVNHQTKEISVLPAWAAANPLTGFMIGVSKEKDTMINSEKAQKIEDMGIPKEQLDGLENANAADKAKAEQLKLETKENEEVEAPAAEEPTPVEAEPEATDPVEAEPVQEETPEPVPPALTVEDVTEAIKSVVMPLVERLGTLESELKELKVSDEKKIAKEVSLTPRESLFASLERAIGNPGAQVDGRTKEAKDGPKETEVKEQMNSIGIPFISKLDDWRSTLPAKQ